MDPEVSEVERFIRLRGPSFGGEIGDTFKQVARSILAEFSGRVDRPLDAREEQAIFLWLAAEWISVAAFVCGRAGATFESVVEATRAEFERGLRKPEDDGGASEATTQE